MWSVPCQKDKQQVFNMKKKVLVIDLDQLHGDSERS